ncbi:hypothetical protein C6I20_07345 [Aeromicrobium sp. A1-2]|uniref:hypothetical protein n=1 Tax=Aeromicrobium sp. A1-2 TaxID=2107713 RepID=UPI000E4D56C3|nr:hypothetical protein [Aeromicrobium sp. A1-2]AXT85019.1 hypothetical protein C6I20_07345 [Aeromicrobium sp. A1-2]
MSEQNSPDTSQLSPTGGGTPEPPEKKSVTFSFSGLIKILIAVLLAITVAVFLTFCQSTKADATVTPVTATSEEALKAQEKCFEAELFYDATGICYSQDISTMPDLDRPPFVVPASADPEPGAKPVAPAPVAVAGKPVAPTAVATPTTTTTTTPTTSTDSLPSVPNHEWVLRLRPDPDPTTGEPDQNADSGSYNLRFTVNKGGVSGSQFVYQLETTVTMTGSFDAKRHSTNLQASAGNKGTYSFTSAQMNAASNSITGRYTQRIGTHVKSGNFTMTRN